MICPVCYDKIKEPNTICPTCGFNIKDLKEASNKEVKKARAEGRYDDIIYTNKFPSDLDYKKTFLKAIFGGWFGLHNFYVNKTFKAWFNLLSFFLSFISAMLVFSEIIADEYMSIVFYTTFLFVITLLMWTMDLVNLALKSFKVPVVIKKNFSKKGKRKND
jgi:TM2 domain-containing membrane protein YozV